MKSSILPVISMALLGGVSAYGQTLVTSDITSNTTWSGEIVLDGTTFVHSGATLTILPGTIVRGQPRTAGVVSGSTVGDPGALIVTQTGRIVANGSAAEPIIFTTAAIDNNNDGIPDSSGGFLTPWTPGDTFYDDAPKTAPLSPLDAAGNANLTLWGGVAVLGNAPTNNANKGAVGFGKTLVEGLTVPGFPAAFATYGGVLPHDNSGIIRYVSIRHAGDEIGSGNELNGLTLGGVGDGTTIEYVEIYCNFDDGIEWFGGTVNGKYLAVFFAGDDSFDIDEGYTGTNQFCFGIMPFFNQNDTTAFGSGSGDKLVEFDGDNYRPDNTAFNDNVSIRLDVTQTVVDTTPFPLSNAEFWNLTGIGSTLFSPAFTPVSAASTNRGFQFRNGAAGGLFNSIIVNTGAETGFEIDAGIGKGAPGFDAVDNVANNLIYVVASTFSNGAALGANEVLAAANGDALATRLGFSGSTNAVNPAFFSLAQQDVSFDPTATATGGKLAASLLSQGPINPRTFSFSVGAGITPPAGQGLDSTANFRGAFRSTEALWTDGWTVLSIAGMLQ